MYTLMYVYWEESIFNGRLSRRVGTGSRENN